MKKILDSMRPYEEGKLSKREIRDYICRGTSSPIISN